LDMIGGKDICRTRAYVCDPHEERNANVPRRQFVFGPDSFSTELTTATTNFYLVVTGQLCDASSGTANPRVLQTGQFWVALEMAPDLAVNDTDLEPGQPGPDDAAGRNTLDDRLRYYRLDKPRYFKTYGVPTAAPDPAGQDWSLRYIRGKIDAAPRDGKDCDSMDKDCATLPADTHSSVAKEWIDFRGVKNDPAAIQAFYNTSANGGRQTKKRVLIRSFWQMSHPYF
ncbi:MAG TPA: hypothetical protein VEJ63_22935, partial [Planctomycetota bacterium]|nr:hypothetical protein [Planctomycetota bacterium]